MSSSVDVLVVSHRHSYLTGLTRSDFCPGRCRPCRSSWRARSRTERCIHPHHRQGRSVPRRPAWLRYTGLLQSDPMCLFSAERSLQPRTQEVYHFLGCLKDYQKRAGTRFSQKVYDTDGKLVQAKAMIEYVAPSPEVPFVSPRPFISGRHSLTISLAGADSAWTGFVVR